MLETSRRGPTIASAGLPEERRGRRLNVEFRLLATILGVILTIAMIGPWLAPHDPMAQDLTQRLRPPAFLGGPPEHQLGTDQLGRDVLSRVLYAGRVSVLVGIVSVTAAALIGLGLGTYAGFRPGLAGTVIMRLADAQFSFPFLILAIAVIAAVGTSLFALVFVLVITQWATFARIARADTLSVATREFIEAARAIGCSDARVLRKHVWPNIMSSMVVIWSHMVAHAVIAEGSLSFLGLGVQAPLPSWGNMLADGRGYLDSAWWIATAPGISLTLLIIVVNFFADALRDVLDPRSRTGEAGARR